MLIKRVRRNDMLPPLCDVAWLEDYDNVAVCLPVPLNLLAAACRAVWIFARYGHMRLPRSARDAYHRGWNAAMADVRSKYRHVMR